MSNNRELKEIFEYELKTKLSEKAKYQQMNSKLY